jgi:hypothetical protein
MLPQASTESNGREERGFAVFSGRNKKMANGN